MDAKSYFQKILELTRELEKSGTTTRLISKEVVSRIQTTVLMALEDRDVMETIRAGNRPEDRANIIFADELVMADPAVRTAVEEMLLAPRMSVLRINDTDLALYVDGLLERVEKLFDSGKEAEAMERLSFELHVNARHKMAFAGSPRWRPLIAKMTTKAVEFFNRMFDR